MPTRLVLLGPHSETLRTAVAALPASLDLQLLGASTAWPEARAAYSPAVTDIAIVAADGGFAMVEATPPAERPTAVIFVSSRDDDAVHAFSLGAAGFLSEPVAPERLLAAVTRARHTVLQQALLRTAEELQRLLAESAVGAGVGASVAPLPSLPVSAPAPAASTPREPLRSVLVREGRRTRFVPLTEVDWFEADGNYVVVHAGAQRFRTRGTIASIEAGLDPRQFARIHRRIVVNMDRVRELSPLPGGDGLLKLGDGATLRLSRTYRARVR